MFYSSKQLYLDKRKNGDKKMLRSGKKEKKVSKSNVKKKIMFYVCDTYMKLHIPRYIRTYIYNICSTRTFYLVHIYLYSTQHTQVHKNKIQKQSDLYYIIINFERFFFLTQPLTKKIIPFIINNNKCWKINNINFPYSFHSIFLII